MSSSDSSATSVKKVLSDARILAERQSGKVQRNTTESAKFADITQINVFAQILLNPSLSPEAKRDEMVEALTFSKDATKEENRAKLEAFSLFKEYLQEQRKVLNREGIKLQDTEAFAELQSVIDAMTAASVEFQDRVKPLWVSGAWQVTRPLLWLSLVRGSRGNDLIGCEVVHSPIGDYRGKSRAG